MNKENFVFILAPHEKIPQIIMYLGSKYKKNPSKLTFILWKTWEQILKKQRRGWSIK